MNPRARDPVLNYLKAVLPGKNLYELAARYSVTVRRDGQVNKGWVGQTIEHVAQLDAGNSPGKDGDDFELKTTSLVRGAAGWRPKETIKVTQLSPQNLLEEEFETSAFWNKLSRLILVGVAHPADDRCEVVKVSAVDITAPEVIGEIRSFWEDVRYSLLQGEFPENPFRGTSDDWVQLRGLGTGQEWSVCPISGERFRAKAFYATKRLICRVFELPEV